jgi:predicted extracellular nuclease
MLRLSHASASVALCLSLSLAACQGSSTTTTSGTGASGNAGGQGGGGAGGGAGGAGGEGLVGTPVKVANWNVRNFFDAVDNPAIDNDSEQVFSPSEYADKGEKVGAVLTALAADVVVLSEVENQTVLDDLNTNHLAGAYPHRAIVDSNDPRGIDVGVLSKLPLVDVVSHKDDMFTVEGSNAPVYQFARDCMEFHFEVDGRRVVLLGVHYRSKGPPDDADKRLAEAQRSRAIAAEVAALHPDAAIAILGDFNDLPGSLPVEWVRLGPGGEPWIDAPDFVPTQDRWTFEFMGDLELIDHQFSNPVLASMLDQSSVVIRHGADVEAAGDHAPIMATYYVTAP